MEDVSVAASDTLQEIMTKSALSDGSGSRILTEPLLVWLDSRGSQIVNNSLQSGEVDEVSQSLCKLITALGDHSTSYIAAHMASPASISLLPSAGAALIHESQNKTKGQLSQGFLKLLLAYTGFPGYYGADEDVSEMTLGFWYMLQEALWNNDFYIEDGGEPSIADQQSSVDQTAVAKELYVQVVKVLRGKIKYPGPGNGWSRGVCHAHKSRLCTDLRDLKINLRSFKCQLSLTYLKHLRSHHSDRYRRDVGDILINAYGFSFVCGSSDSQFMK